MSCLISVRNINNWTRNHFVPFVHLHGKTLLLSIRMRLGMSMPKLHYLIWISEGGECCFLTVDKRPVGEANLLSL